MTSEPVLIPPPAELEGAFKKFTEKRLILYKFLIISCYGKPWRKPIIWLDGIAAYEEPVAVKIPAGSHYKQPNDHLWEEFDEDYYDFEVGKIVKKEPLPTLKEIIESGEIYWQEMMHAAYNDLI